MKIKQIIPAVGIMTLMLLAPTTVQATDSLELSSSAFIDKGQMPATYSCEGEGISPPLSWSGVPDGTQSLLIIMDHQPDARSAEHKDKKPKMEMANKDEKRTQKSRKAKRPEGLHWYWGLYNIPIEISETTAENSVGTLGSNSVNHKNEYAPPCSKGPGLKTYTFHLYALSKMLEISESEDATEALLRKKMDGLVLDSDDLAVTFERSCQSPPKPRPKQENIQPEENKPPSQLPLCEASVSTIISKDS